MSALFSKPKTPEPRKVNPAPPPPERSSAETQELAESQRQRFARRGGRASTMLTSGFSTETAGFASRFLGGTGG